MSNVRPHEVAAVVRVAQRTDIPAMHGVRLAVRAPTIEDTGRGWVAEEHGSVVGFAVGNVRTGNIWALFVDPMHELRSHGGRLHDPMKLRRLYACLLLVSTSLCSANPALEAAQRSHPQVAWQGDSVVQGEFTCRGRTEHGILGTTPDEIVVAVFIRGFPRMPEVLRFSASIYSASSIQLSVERLAFDLKVLESELGWIPPGLRPSKRCLGLRLNDDRVDPVHIYWNRSARRFQAWSQ